MTAAASTPTKSSELAHATLWFARASVHAHRRMVVTITVARGTTTPTRKSVRHWGHGAPGTSGQRVPLHVERGNNPDRGVANHPDAGPSKIVRLVRGIKTVRAVVGGSSGMMASGTSVAVDNTSNTRKQSTARECAIASRPIRP